MLHIASYHYYPLAEIHIYQGYSTFHVIDIWTWNEFSMFGHEHIFSPSLWFSLTKSVKYQVLFTSFCVHFVKRNDQKN
jgi:hypothetical protein